MLAAAGEPRGSEQRRSEQQGPAPASGAVGRRDRDRWRPSALAASAFARVERHRRRSRCPGSIGRTQDGATALAKDEGLSIGTVATQVAVRSRRASSSNQSPAAGSFTSEPHVNLVVSIGSGAGRRCPTIVGKPWSTAQKQLDAVGFAYGAPTSVYSDTDPVRQRHPRDAAGRQAGRARRASSRSCCRRATRRSRFPISAGSRSRTRPTQLQGAGFKPNARARRVQQRRARQEGGEDDPGRRVRTRRSARTVHGHALAGDRSWRRCPPLLGLTLAEAQGRLDAAHLEFSINGPVRGGEVVVDQTPDAGRAGAARDDHGRAHVRQAVRTG